MDGAELLRRDLDAVLAELAAAIAQHVPGFNVGIEEPSHPLRRQRQKVLRMSLSGMADAIDARHGTGTVATTATAVDWGEHRELGRMECRYGRPLSDILQAPWAASRTILRHAVDRAGEAGLAPADVHEIAEVVIDWSDRISLAFSEGYNDESAARAGQMETRRQHLVELVLADPPSSAEAVTAAAREAEWRPPSHLRVLVARGGDRDQFRRRLPPGGLAAEIGDELCAFLPEPFPPGGLRAAPPAPGTVVAVGPPFALAEARASAGLARRALDLAAEGLLAASEVIDCTEHELTLLVFADPLLARRFSDGLLGPVAHKPALVATLAVWLKRDGRVKATAAELGVHPHTVTYRLDRLRDLLGPVLDDASRRLELHLAVRIHQARSPAAGRVPAAARGPGRAGPTARTGNPQPAPTPAIRAKATSSRSTSGPAGW